MKKTLTEQYKNKELSGWYYVKAKDGSINHWLLFTDSIEFDKDGDIEEVLSPVPNYEEFVQQRDFVKDHMKVLIENMNLKRKLEIATKALKEYANCKPTEWMSCVTADNAIKEMEGVK